MKVVTKNHSSHRSHGSDRSDSSDSSGSSDSSDRSDRSDKIIQSLFKDKSVKIVTKLQNSKTQIVTQL